MRSIFRKLAVALGFVLGFSQLASDDFGRIGTSLVGAAFASDPCVNDSCGDPGFPNNRDPSKENGGNDPDCPKDNCAGNPINYATGNKFQVEADYRGAGPFPIVIKRFYNSRDFSAAHEFGLRWSGSYSRSLLSIGATTFARRDDGSIYTFKMIGSIWTPDANVNARLVQTATGWLYTNSRDETETYDGSGRLISIASRAGLTLTITRDAAGRIASVTDHFGRVATFAYVSAAATAFVASVTAPDGGVYRYGYDASNRLVSATDPVGGIRKYVYENPTFPNLLTGVVDENNGRFSTFTYDANQLATKTSHAGGADAYTIDYTKLNVGIVDVTGPLGGVTKHGMKGLNGSAVENVAKRDCGLNCAGSVYYTLKLYDANGNVIQFRDESLAQTTYAYDLARNLETSRTLGEGSTVARTITTSWHPTFRLPTEIIDGDRSREFSYDAKGNLTSATLASPTATSQWRFTYNSFGEVLTVTDPLGRVTNYSYDAKGNLSSIANALNQVVRITAYDANGRPLSITDANGLVTSFTYNFRGQITSRTKGQRVTTYSYDPVGLLTRITRPDGSFLTGAYDAAHRLIRVTDSLGNRTDYTLDAAGNRLKEQVFDSANVLRKTHSWTYDAFGRIATDTGASEQTSNYSSDSRDMLTSFTDPNSESRSWAYDPLKRLATYGSGPGTVNFTYDDYDNLSTIADESGRDTLYDHTGLDRLKTVWSPDTGLTDRAFDAAGNVTLSLDNRGVFTSYVYDRLNRPTRVAYSNGENVFYAYDQGPNGIGHLTTMIDRVGATYWAYDAYGSVTQRIQIIGAIKLTTKWFYDPVKGRLNSMVYPSGAVARYFYDAAGRVASVYATPTGGAQAPVATAIKYFPFGPVESWYAGNRAYYTRKYDLDGRLKWIAPPSGKGITYTYDAGGRITLIQERGLLDKNFQYTTGNRLYNFSTTDLTQSYAYDAVGNRTSMTVDNAAGSKSITYNYRNTSNRLNSLTGSAFETWRYDAVGNVVTDAAVGVTRAFAYDGANRQSLATVGAVSRAYKVDGLGQRVAKYNAATNQPLSFVQFDLDGHALGQYGATGALTQETIWLGDTPIGVISPTGLLYIAPDHLDAPHEITDAAKARVWFWDHDPFGNGQPTGTFTYDMRFPGQLYDSETGNYYNYYRDYDPRIGRYIESDPIGLAGGTNTYSYAEQNPISQIDPTGLGICFYNSRTGKMSCTSTIPDGEGRFDGDFASGNNNVQGCKNNPACEWRRDVGPIPRGRWKWDPDPNNNTKPGGRRLYPVRDDKFGPNPQDYRKDILSHSCKNPFGPSKGERVCSAGCVTGTRDTISKLNRFLEDEWDAGEENYLEVYSD